MTWTLCTSGAAISKAGLHANSVIVASGSVLLNWATEAEGRISAECHTDATTFTGKILTAAGNVCSSMVAMNIIMWDTTGYLTREADTLLNVNDEIITKGIAQIKDKTKQRLST